MHPDGRGFGPYFERLDLAGVDLSPHGRRSGPSRPPAPDSAARIGVVEAVRIERGALVAKLRFSERAEVAPILQDLAAGIGRQVSIGYSVEEWTNA